VYVFGRERSGEAVWVAIMVNIRKDVRKVMVDDLRAVKSTAYIHH